MKLRARHAMLLLLACAACASAGGGKGKAPAVVHQADEKIPPLAAFQPGDERTAYNAALGEEQRGWRAESAGDVAGAREPLEAAARAYVAFLDRFPNTGWDVTFRYHAADLLRRAGRHDDAIATAQQVAADPRADPKSKAMAQLQVANATTAAGRLQPLQIEPRPRGSARDARPQALPEPWQRFVQATDAYLQALPPTRAEPEDRTLSAAQLALVAARVAYATGDMEGARRRLAVILDRWPGESQVFQGAAPLYVQTFVAVADDDGARQAIEQVRETAGAQAQRAQGDDARQAYEKVATDLDRVAAGVRYERAKALLEQGQSEEAAQAFEAVAQEGGDVAASLAAAAIAWDRAGNGDRAAELRRRLLEQHADAKVTPGAALQLAAYLSKKGDHAGAAQVYATHADRWRDDPNHCTALRNGAVERDLAKQIVEAAERYRAFGGEERCVQASPDVAAMALYRAGQLYLAAKNRAEARASFEAAANVPGVQTPEAKKRVADAKSQAKKLGTAAGRRSPAR